MSKGAKKPQRRSARKTASAKEKGRAKECTEKVFAKQCTKKNKLKEFKKRKKPHGNHTKKTRQKGVRKTALKKRSWKDPAKERRQIAPRKERTEKATCKTTHGKSPAVEFAETAPAENCKKKLLRENTYVQICCQWANEKNPRKKRTTRARIFSTQEKPLRKKRPEETIAKDRTYKLPVTECTNKTPLLGAQPNQRRKARQKRAVKNPHAKETTDKAPLKELT